MRRISGDARWQSHFWRCRVAGLIVVNAVNEGACKPHFAYLFRLKSCNKVTCVAQAVVNGPLQHHRAPRTHVCPTCQKPEQNAANCCIHVSDWCTAVSNAARRPEQLPRVETSLPTLAHTRTYAEPSKQSSVAGPIKSPSK